MIKRWFWRVKVSVLALLATLDEVTDVFALLKFREQGAWPFFWASIVILVMASASGGFLGMLATSPNYRSDPSYRSGVCLGITFGMLGLSPIVEAINDLREGQETGASGAVKIFEAQFESASQFILQLLYITVDTWRGAWETSRIVVYSCGISFFSLALQFATYAQSPAGIESTVKMTLRSGTHSKVLTVGFLFYFASDLTLRALAVCVLGYAAEGWAWIVAVVYLATHVLTIEILKPKSFEVLICAFTSLGIGSSLFMLMDVFGSKPQAKGEFVVSTVGCVAAVIAGLYWPGLPHPHVDPTFRAASMGMMATAASAKVVSFIWYVFPAKYGSVDKQEAHLIDVLSA